MTEKLTRRLLLGGALGVAGVAGVAAVRLGLPGPGASRADAPRKGDARVDTLIAMSRDDAGSPHIERAAFVAGGVVIGSLPMSRPEMIEVLEALQRNDFTAFQQRGLVLGGQKFFFLRAEEDGTTLHALRSREFLTVCAADHGVIFATSNRRMAPGRAVDAVRRFSSAAFHLG
jgi:hypothetical protein